MAEDNCSSLKISKLLQLSWRESADLFRAVLALGKARLQLRYIDTIQFQQSPTAQAKTGQNASPAPHVVDWIARVTWAIPRAAQFVPWRSDCLVQAQAAQNWFKRFDIHSQIQLGARKLPDGRMDAHAWLVCEGEIVTGGDIEPFAPFRWHF